MTTCLLQWFISISLILLSSLRCRPKSSPFVASRGAVSFLAIYFFLILKLVIYTRASVANLSINVIEREFLFKNVLISQFMVDLEFSLLDI